MNNVPTRVLAAELDRAKYWTPWPALLEAERPVPIEEPPTEATEVEEENDDEEDEEEESRNYSYQEFLEASEGIKNP